LLELVFEDLKVFLLQTGYRMVKLVVYRSWDEHQVRVWFSGVRTFAYPIIKQIRYCKPGQKFARDHLRGDPFGL
jgi:hypothetical protein